MSRYNQDNVPEEVLNRFPTLKNRPPSISRVQPSVSQQITVQQSDSKQGQCENSNVATQQCSDQKHILEELQKKFPQFNSIKNQVVLEKSQVGAPPLQQSSILLVSQVKSLNKEFAPENLPLKEQIAINKATCSLCPNHKKTQSGLFKDLPISHESPTKKKYF
ncbi:hypothetical protein TTHERM_01026410 (macronuclear) [Tetrahymena thermophila SB210]|uniref:Uncharacterized protein n=1 Tax=Tetrahymena thermophila (strain SB210) TaxID=312017 RepID=Q22CN8_TETTS|nr:hypothetical protein TTHERM_01026410 [Tetrahymena thermophila SB210]EAR83077.1 hypothetical protein TTHERM_01026410 [Tetrahymena thermophila SB210]|eukprot:XP_001030740.1 hypothetical protein TTHERM_01026410 [Tetrahymena thermophila SB210]